jgi:hypothetical protein
MTKLTVHSGDELVEPKKLTTKPQGFFAVDRGAFRCAAAGGLNPALAHLVMARGTGRDNCTTQWSVHAIVQRTGISRPNAAKAVAYLLYRGIWKRVRDGKHPIYEVVAGHQIPGGSFTEQEQQAVAACRDGRALSHKLKAVGDTLIIRGLAKQKQRGSRIFELDEAAINSLTEPMAVWLPNTLVDGAADEVPPLELIRQTRSASALRLLIELYAVQFLPIYGGVPRDMVQVQFERAEIGQQGPFVVWGFKPKHWKSKAKHMTCSDKFACQFFSESTRQIDGRRLDAGWDASFWSAVNTLKDVGLIEQVGLLLDGDDAEAEIIHPYAIDVGEPAERELTDAAVKAARAMITQGQLSWAIKEGYYPRLVPVPRHIAVTMVEVIRLKYRPHTKATAAWYAQMCQMTGEYLCRYRALGENEIAKTAKHEERM